MYLRLPTTFAVIFGSFTLGLYVAIQGPTLMDLIDILHVNNDIMSYSLAFASLAYSVGGLFSGFLFNYVNRQILISAYFLIFGISNIITPFISNYFIFSVITVFKMMCAGGTDCGANVWILEMWPGKDAWLQALHFTFAIGCALGPLIVEPFLSVEAKENEIDKIAGKTSGTASINDQNNESRIHIPYAVSGLASIIASVAILYLYILNEREKRRLVHLKAKQQSAAGEHILLTSIRHPAALEAGGDDTTRSGCCHAALEPLQELGEPTTQELEPLRQVSVLADGRKQADENVLTKSAVFLPKLQLLTNPQNSTSSTSASNRNNQPSPPPPSTAVQLYTTSPSPTTAAASTNHVANVEKQQEVPLLDNNNTKVKITSKCKDELVGRPPYYVMFAIALSAMCLSFYCGIEITSMNYLATFAVNIDLQLNKSTAALMSSALTISFAVGRAFGIWIAAYMRPHKLFYLCASIMATGNVFMLIFANTAETLLWYSICLFGIGCGPMFPAIVSFYDDRISKVTNTVSGIFILGSMFNVALNSLIIGHHIIDNALILIVCNLVGSVILLLLFGTLHMLTKVKKNQRVKKFRLKQQGAGAEQTASSVVAVASSSLPPPSQPQPPPSSSSSPPPPPPPLSSISRTADSQLKLEQQAPLLSAASNQHQSKDDFSQEQTTINDNNNNNNNRSSSSTSSSSNINNNSNIGNEDDNQHQHHQHHHVGQTAATVATTT